MQHSPELIATAVAMKELPDDIRRAAIDAGDNVVGFDRFGHRAKQVQLADAYRSPVKPEGAA